jgi:CRP-like cAMP-binding protein
MIERHLNRLRARHDISDAEERAIRAAVGEVREYRAGETFIHAGEELTQSTLLLDGIMCRYKDLRSGERQVTELHVPGDFADLHSFTLKHLDHEIMALTRCQVVLVPHAALSEITERHPHLTRVYWFSTNMDAAIHREWAVSLGRRDARARTAHLFCELQARLGLVDLADEAGFAFDITQIQLAECLGLTSVHVNRVLRELREERVMTFRSRRVVIHDADRLRRIAEFDPSYLYLERRPR